jgi:peroxiredoxin
MNLQPETKGQKMRTHISLFLSVVVSLVILSCGTQNQPTETEISKPQISEVKLVLKVFAGYPCPACNEELPLFNSRLANELGNKSGRLDARVYVVGGPNWSKATQEVADRYGQELGLTQFQMYPDNRCQTEYVKYYPGSKCLVPATVLLRPTGEVVEVYEPGAANLDEFMSRIKELINE